MDIHSSWISLEKIICFKKSDRTKENCSILGVKKGAQKAEIVLVSGKDLTTWNFVRKFFGFGPLAGIDLHIRSVNNLLEKNWSTLSSNFENIKESKYCTLQACAIVINNLVQISEKAKDAKKKDSQWASQLKEIQNEISKKFTDLGQLKEFLDEDLLAELPITLLEKMSEKIKELGDSAKRFTDLLKDLNSLSKTNAREMQRLRNGSIEIVNCTPLRYKTNAPEIEELLNLLLDNKVLFEALFRENTLSKETKKLLETNSILDVDSIIISIKSYRDICQHELFQKMSCQNLLAFNQFISSDSSAFLQNKLDKIHALPDSFFSDTSWIIPTLLNDRDNASNEVAGSFERNFDCYINRLIEIDKKEKNGEVSKKLSLIWKLILEFSPDCEYENYEKNQNFCSLCSSFGSNESSYFRQKIFELLKKDDPCKYKMSLSILQFFLTPKGLFENLITKLHTALKIEETVDPKCDELISILAQKPLEEQDRWLTATLKSLKNQMTPLSKELDFSYLKQVSLEEFETNLELFSFRPTPLIDFCSFIFKRILQENIQDILANVLKLENLNLDFDSICGLLLHIKHTNMKQPFDLINERLSALSMKVKQFFDLNNPKEKCNYFWALHSLITVEDLKEQDLWLEWLTELLREETYQFFIEIEFKRLNLTKIDEFKKIFNPFFKDASLNERIDNNSSFAILFSYVYPLLTSENAEKKLAIFSQIIESLRFYKIEQQISAFTFEKGFHRESKQVFPAKELIEIIGEDPSLQDLQQVLDGKNIAYNQMLERWEKAIQEESSKSKNRKKSARSAF